MTPLYTLTRPCKVGIWDTGERTARVYKDKIILETPYVRWIGNTGSLAVAKNSIRNPQVVGRILQELQDDCEDTAWEIIDQNMY